MESGLITRVAIFYVFTLNRYFFCFSEQSTASWETEFTSNGLVGIVVWCVHIINCAHEQVSVHAPLTT